MILTLREIIDFSFVCAEEKRKDKGEDAHLWSIDQNHGIVGVFDGCGGSGAKQYSKLRNKTGAYVASRISSDATKKWFETFCKDNFTIEPEKKLKEIIVNYLKLYAAPAKEKSNIRGDLQKDFPTTIAINVVSWDGKKLWLQSLWAGDSRCYILSKNGLAQITLDDIHGNYDAMENLSKDGVLSNVISLSKDFYIHRKCIELTEPCIIFAATDGCFGYYETPMEFEYLLLTTLVKTNNPAEWEQRMKDQLQNISGDDFSMIGFSLGYGSYQKIKREMDFRRKILFENYIEKINVWRKTKVPTEEKSFLYSLWDKYKESYCRYDQRGI